MHPFRFPFANCCFGLGSVPKFRPLFSASRARFPAEIRVWSDSGLERLGCGGIGLNSLKSWDRFGSKATEKYEKDEFLNFIFSFAIFHF